MTGKDRWDQVPGQTPVGKALGKQFSKIMFPTVNGGTSYTEKAFELLQGPIRISSLSKGGGDKKHRCPVYPAPPKPNRWGQDTAPAAFTTAAQAIANLKCLIQIRRTAPRLSRIVGVM
jgi:hypothetical protein